MPLSSYSLTPILLGRYLVKHDIRIGDSREGNLQFANLQRLCLGLIAAMDRASNRAARVRSYQRPRRTGGGCLSSVYGGT